VNGMFVDFRKYQALGNDYIVIDPAEFPLEPSPEAVKAICDRSFGAGSDGILLGPLSGPDDIGGLGTGGGLGRIRRLGDSQVPWLRIFNPDGSEAEKSGNGLRIFSLYLAEAGYVGTEDFRICASWREALMVLDSVNSLSITTEQPFLT